MTSLYALKPWYTRRLSRLVEVAVSRSVSPDVFTALGLLAAVAAAVAVAYEQAVPAAVLLAARLAGANLDGAVARARGVARPWGSVLNELGDRASDLVVFAGLVVLAVRQTGAGPGATDDVLGPVSPVVLVLVAAVAAGLPTFVSLAAAAAGATRRNGGPLGKTERCAVAALAALVPGWLAWLAALLIVGSLATTAVRLRAAYWELSDLAGTTPATEPTRGTGRAA